MKKTFLCMLIFVCSINASDQMFTHFGRDEQQVLNNQDAVTQATIAELARMLLASEQQNNSLNERVNQLEQMFVRLVVRHNTLEQRFGNFVFQTMQVQDALDMAIGSVRRQIVGLQENVARLERMASQERDLLEARRELLLAQAAMLTRQIQGGYQELR